MKHNPGQGLLLNKDYSFGLLGGSLISWKSKKQHTVSLSSAKAKYRSLCRLTSELAWLSRLLHELDVPNVIPVLVKCDNQASIYAKNPVYHQHTKHLELDCHFVHAKLSFGLITLSYTPSKHQFANICTKPLKGLQHHHLLCKLGVSSTPSNLKGG